MTGFTHYSLYEMPAGRAVADFATLPAGGLPELLADLHHRILPESPEICISVTRGTLHPDGQQMSFGLGVRGEASYDLILMTRACVAEHAAELASEGNDSAELAKSALAE